LQKAGEFFTKSRQLLLEAFVEHGKAPMDWMESGVAALTIGLGNLF
jgi:hypothetical protein